MAAIPIVKLAEYVDLLAGFAFDSANFTNDPSDIPLVKGENVSQGSILWSISKRWSVAEWSNFEKYQLWSGDVIVAMDRPWVPAGLKWAYIRKEDPKALLVQRCSRLRSNSPKLDQDFLRFVVGGSGFESYIKPITTGVNVPHISGRQILDYEFLLPTLPAQQRIAGILSAYDELIENSQRRIKILESSARALYREWFVHFRYPGHESVSLVPSALGDIPQGWEVKKLSDTCRLTMGQSPKSEFYNETGEGIAFHQGVTDFGDRFPSDRLYCTADGRIAEVGDILFSVRAPVGRLNIANKKICLGRGLSAIRHNQNHQAFLWEQLRNRFTKDDMMGNGAIFASVTKDDMQGIQLVCPPVSLVRAATQNFEPLHIEIATLSQQIQNLRTTRDLLLPRLLSGQIEVGIAA